jgi:hypothetical protein
MAVDHPGGSEVQGFSGSSKVGGGGGTRDVFPEEDPGVLIGSPWVFVEPNTLGFHFVMVDDGFFVL